MKKAKKKIYIKFYHVVPIYFHLSLEIAPNIRYIYHCVSLLCFYKG